MKKEAIERYKEAIKDQYDLAKHGANSDYLIVPSPAKLRDLCYLLFEQGLHAEDLDIFEKFFGFKNLEGQLGYIKGFDVDKFRPIRSFFLRQSDLMDVKSINLAAALADYKPRPFLKFKVMEMPEEEIVPPIRSPYLAVSADQEMKADETGKTNKQDGNNQLETQKARKVIIRKPWYKEKIIWAAGILLLLFLGYTAKEIVFPSDACMYWDKTHYETIGCDARQPGIKTIPTDKELLAHMRKIEPDSNYVFFVGQKPQVWYSKEGNVMEFFTFHGLHPVTGETLKPITRHMIEEHVLKNNQD